MKRVKIRSPIWKDRSIGVAEYHFKSIFDAIEIEITYENKQGDRIYPRVYVLSWDEANMYRTQIVRGTQLRIIPISELREK